MVLSDDLIKSIIVALPATLAAIGTLWVSLTNSKKIDVVHDTTNSKMDALGKVIRAQALLEGEVIGRLAGKSEAENAEVIAKAGRAVARIEGQQSEKIAQGLAAGQSAAVTRAEGFADGVKSKEP